MAVGRVVTRSTPVFADADRTGAGGRGLGWISLTIGLLLPCTALLFELKSHGCMSLFFDPIPTWPHVFLVASVPAAVLFAHLVGRSGSGGAAPLAARGTGIAVGVALLYTLTFLPLSAFAVTGLGLSPVILYSAVKEDGLGILWADDGWALLVVCVLPWLCFAPLFGLIGAGLARRALRRSFPGRVKAVSLSRWVTVGMALFLFAELPGWVVNAGLSAPFEQRIGKLLGVEDAGLRLLRVAADEELLVRSLRYGPHNVQVTGLLSQLFGRRLPSERREERFYRVTGRTLAAEPQSRLPGSPVPNVAWLQGDGLFRGTDRFQGGEEVGHGLGDVSLVSSRLEGELHGSEGFGYMEWTLVFRNQGGVQREARALVKLPEGGVVSRATLWVNGEPREAAFAGKAEARAAYEQIVRQRRDPLLVTAQGPNEVLVQCFPIPPEGGEMQIRLGVSAPLQLLAEDRSVLVLPHFAEKNFDLAEGTEHALELRAPEGLNLADGTKQVPELRRRVSEAELARGTPVVVSAPERLATLAVRDARSRRWQRVVQEMAQPVDGEVERIVAVVDASAGTAPYANALARGLAELAHGRELFVVLAADAPELLGGGTGAVGREAAAALAQVRFRGGHDNSAGLALAVQLARERESGAVLWLHAPQSVKLSIAEPLYQTLYEQQTRTDLFLLPLASGPNRTLQRIQSWPPDRVRTIPVPRSSQLSDDLRHFARALDAGRAGVQTVRRRVGRKLLGRDVPLLNSSTSVHLSRLWAYEESQRLAATGAVADAATLAMRYELVTPWTGAVVLENDVQYARAGLSAPTADPDDPSLDGEPPETVQAKKRAAEPATPPDPDTDPLVPAIPEPGAALLFGLGLALVARRGRRRLG